MDKKYSLNNSAKLVSSELLVMATDDEKARSIRFPENLWDAIDRDAKKAKRSAVKQMEVVLSMYYGVEDVEVDKQKLLSIKEAQNKKGSQVIDINVGNKPDKKEKLG